MIVYNVAHRFFEFKEKADRYRRTKMLLPGALHKLNITNRAELATLLNLICTNPAERDPAEQSNVQISGSAHAEPEAIPHYVPKFLHKDCRS